MMLNFVKEPRVKDPKTSDGKKNNDRTYDDDKA